MNLARPSRQGKKKVVEKHDCNGAAAIGHIRRGIVRGLFLPAAVSGSVNTGDFRAQIGEMHSGWVAL
ncbi:uncharacterized protein B0I36DRAFT_86925 [Microdochium trichocladiopsis]|uniref:Uncharacterized protein n=1 Tax=Microdochium trichocladiopsis TaxID=1682393 RepID=A0A9P8YBJ0_9PEZI|nr:uncharacterized protein B0I36DRAFT_86925 [Microdochium trichocladiopsis]KAH7035019.1 hypothetical protein B0I36DRAFT_86925 [Microdochium trichocladiopsis]